MGLAYGDLTSIGATLAANAASNLLGGLGSGAGMPANEDTHTSTLSVISPATVTLTGTGNAQTDANSAQTVATLTSRDASTANGALENTLTLQQAAQLQAQQKVAQQNQQAANLVGAVMANAIGDVAQANGWADGSSQKLMLHGVSGAIQAAIAGGNIGAGLAAGVANEALTGAVADYLKNQGIDPFSKDGQSYLKAASTLIGAAAGALVGSSAGAAVGGNVALVNTTNNYLSHPQAQEKKDKLAKAKTEEERNQINRDYDKLDAKQSAEAAACLLKDQCGSVFDKASLRSTLDELNAACTAPRLCTSEEKASIAQLNNFYTLREAVKPDTTIEEFLLTNKLLGAAFSVARSTVARLMGESSTTLARPLGVVEDFQGGTINAFEAAPQYAFKAETDFVKTGANLESAATRFVKDEAGKDFIATFDSKIGSQGIDLAYAKMVNGQPQLVIGEAKAGDSALTALGENYEKTLTRNLARVEDSIKDMQDPEVKKILLQQLRDKTYQVELYTSVGNAAKAAARVDDTLIARMGQPVSRVVTFGKN